MDFKDFNVRDLKKYLEDRGISTTGYLKSGLVELAVAADKIHVPRLERKTADIDSDYIAIEDDVVIPNPFTLKAVNDFMDCPPFGLYDIFNHLIHHSCEYDKQGLASYKSFDDYRLFEDGYVVSLLKTILKNEGIHVVIGKVLPSMREKTKEGKEHYDLWFALEGRGKRRGSVLQARCRCLGGRDGGCKHIAAAMYSLDDLLNNRKRESVTSGPCLWVKRPKAETKPSEIKDLVIKKSKIVPACKRKRVRPYEQNIEDVDVRHDLDKAPRDVTSMEKFTLKMCKLNHVPAVLPLFRHLYLNEVNYQKTTENETQQVDYKLNSPNLLDEKIKQIINNRGQDIDPSNILSLLNISRSEIESVEMRTRDQWKCSEWYESKIGFITASKCHRVFTRQISLENDSTQSACALIRELCICRPPVNMLSFEKEHPENARDWGLYHEKTARKNYVRIESHNHHKLQLLSKGFLISEKKPFLGASVDNIQTCDCADMCSDCVIEFKCPWKHKNIHPKEAFLTPEIGGIVVDGSYVLKPTSKYYFQVQLQMFVTGLHFCAFVVWTTLGIFTTRVIYDEAFMLNVCRKLEAFWVGNVAPYLISKHLPIKENKADQTQILKEENDGSQEQIEDQTNQEEIIENVFETTEKDSSEQIDLTVGDVNVSAVSTVNFLGVDVTRHDVQTLQRYVMTNDAVVTIMIKKIQCTNPFEFADTLFYSILCGEQDLRSKDSSSCAKLKAAEKFFKPRLLSESYVFIPINRSLHWLLAVLTPWHMIFMDSMTWNVRTRQTEADHINNFLEHLYKKVNFSEYQQLPLRILKVPQQMVGSNNCGIYICMFIEMFLKERHIYESDPEAYIVTSHVSWFNHNDAELRRTQLRNQLQSLL